VGLPLALRYSGHVGTEHVAGPYRVRSTQFYIDHPKAKIIFELGWKYEDFMNATGFPQTTGPEGFRVRQLPNENPLAQMEAIGVKPEDIDYVVISHLMSEHAGWLPEFAGKKAQIIVQEKELEYASRLGVPPKPDTEPAVEQFHTWMYHRKHFECPD